MLDRGTSDGGNIVIDVVPNVSIDLTNSVTTWQKGLLMDSNFGLPQQQNDVPTLCIMLQHLQSIACEV